MISIKDLRIAKGLTVRDVAKKLEGIRGGKGYFVAVNRLENNFNSPTVARLEDTLKAMGYGLELWVTDGDQRIRIIPPRGKDTDDVSPILE